MTAADEEARRLAELRSRLYRPDAAPADLERYLAEAGRAAPEAPASSAAPPARPPRRRLAPLLVAGAVAAIAIAGGVLALPRPVPPAPTSSASATAGIGPGQVLTPYGAIIPVPTPVAVSIDGEAAAAQQYRGRGDSRIPLDFSDAPDEGRLAVAIAPLGDAARIEWRAVRVDPHFTPPERTVGSTDSVRRAGAPVPEVLQYRGGPPMLLEVTADTDVRWALQVAYLPAAAADLR